MTLRAGASRGLSAISRPKNGVIRGSTLCGKQVVFGEPGKEVKSIPRIFFYRKLHTQAGPTTDWKRLTSFDIETGLSERNIVKRIYQALKSQDADGMEEMEALNVHLTPKVVVSVLNGNLSAKSKWSFFKWAKAQPGYRHDKDACIAMMKELVEFNLFEAIKQLLADMREEGLNAGPQFYQVALLGLTRAHDDKDALALWEFMKKGDYIKDVHPYNCMIGLLLGRGQFEEALQLYRDMLQSKCRPNHETYHCLIQCLVNIKKLDAADSICKKLPSIGIRPKMMTYDILVMAYLRETENIERAVELLSEMKMVHRAPRKSTVQAIYNALRRAGKSSMSDDFKQAWPMFFDGFVTPNEEETYLFDKEHFVDLLSSWGPETISSLEQIGFKWNPTVVSAIIGSVKSVNVAWEFFKWAKSIDGFTNNARSYSAMIYRLLRNRNFDVVSELINEMKQNELQITTGLMNQVIDSYASNYDALGALKVYEQMGELGVPPNEASYTILIDILMREHHFQRAMDVYGQMLRSGLQPNNYTYSVLINGLGIAGKAEAGQQLLSIMLKHGYKPNVITYTALMGAYSKTRKVSKVMDIYSKMSKEGIGPTPVTYKVLAKAFSRDNQIDKADEMRQKLQTLISSGCGRAVIDENNAVICEAMLKTLENLAVM